MQNIQPRQAIDIEESDAAEETHEGKSSKDEKQEKRAEKRKGTPEIGDEKKEKSTKVAAEETSSTPPIQPPSDSLEISSPPIEEPSNPIPFFPVLPPTGPLSETEGFDFLTAELPLLQDQDPNGSMYTETT